MTKMAAYTVGGGSKIAGSETESINISKSEGGNVTDGEGNSDDILTCNEFLPGYADIKSYSQGLLKSCLNAVKASNGLPSSGDNYDYYSSFRGFRQLMAAEGRHILETITSLLRKENQKIRFEGLELEDKFELLVDANDFIMENVGHTLDEASGVKKNDNLVVASIKTGRAINASWNRKSFGSRSLSQDGTFNLLSGKNILRPQLKFKEKVDNSNSPFVPLIKEKPNSIKPLAIIVEKTEGGEEFSHPYEVEIEKFQARAEHLEKVEPQVSQPLETTSYIFVNKIDELEDLCDELLQHREIAVDLEHHSYRTFQGMTCLMQISTREKDYIIDTLSLRSELEILNVVFTDPKIVKVMHGADRDVLWLQRDFGIYVVNLFDTGQASRVLSFAHFSLSFLMKHYCQVEPDKRFQLADWRIRPLPPEMIRYARGDTHYLLYIYDLMKNDLLAQGNSQKNLLLSVFQRSKILCLKKYQKPLFHEDSYLELYKRSKKVFNSQQLYALRKLYAWRDKMARQEDESLGYVLPNHMLLQIAETLPREQQGILAFCNPIPPLVRQQLNELHSFILKARDSSLIKSEVPELRQQVASAESHIDLDSVLHSLHDMSNDQDTAINLPTLLDSDEQHSHANQTIIAPVKQVATLSLLGRSQEQSTELPSSQSNRNEMKKVAAVLKSFISPYERYKLVKPFKDAVKMEQDEGETVSDLQRIERVHNHFKRLAAMSVPQPSEGVEKYTPNTDSSHLMEDNLGNTTCESTEINNDDEKDESEACLQTQLKKRKKRKKQKLMPTIPLKVQAPENNLQSVQKKMKTCENPSNDTEETTFQSFDYKHMDYTVFKGGAKGKQPKKRDFNPEADVEYKVGNSSQGKMKRRAKAKNIMPSSNITSNKQCWPKR